VCTYFIMKPQPLYLLFSLLVREQCNAFVHFSIRRDSFRGASHVGAFSLTTRHAAQPLGDDGTSETPTAGMLEELKQEEAKLALMLASVRRQKLAVLRGTICIVSQSSRFLPNRHRQVLTSLFHPQARPLSIGIVGFGRFGQFIAKSFAKHGRVIGISRGDYSHVADEVGVTFVPLSDLESLIVEEDLDVIVLAVSIVSFEDTVKALVPHLRRRMEIKGNDSCPLIVDVASVKEHPRAILLENLPEECDICCTHPMFGPDSAQNGWNGLTFVYEKTRINKVVLGDDREEPTNGIQTGGKEPHLNGKAGGIIYDDCDASVEGADRVERFLVSLLAVISKSSIMCDSSYTYFSP
jgi:arogenate dehydrogenase (NADP+)